jgi:hypothetical protein
MGNVRIGLGLDVGDLVASANTAKSSIESVGRALDAALKSGDINSVNDYVNSSTAFRGSYIKNAKLGGYSDVKLDSKDLEAPIKQIKDLMEKMMAEGKSKEAAQYSSMIDKLQNQHTTELLSPMEKEAKAEKERETSLMRSIRGISKSIGNGPNIIGQAGSGNIAGAALGAAGGISDLINILPKGALVGGLVVGGLTALAAGANKLSEQWEKVMQPSMGLAASLGRLSDDADKNHATFQEVFSQATDRKILQGYKLEEGLQLANQLSKMGINSDSVIASEGRVFRHQRVTDADRNTLAQAEGYAQRYRNGENVLGYALGGLKTSGMERGQYQEYLNATLRIFEEGLSKGVVKGFAEITRTQNMLAQIGETWKGEQGLEKINRMNDAFGGASNLDSDYDVMMWRAAQAMNDGNGDAIKIGEILDQGLGDGTILKHLKDVVKETLGGDRTGSIFTYKNMFGLTTTSARELYDYLQKNDFSGAASVIENPENLEKTPEMKLLSATEEIRQNVALWGSDITPLKSSIVDAISRLTNVMAGERAFQSYKTTHREIIQDLGLTDNEVSRVNRLFNQAYTKENQPDSNENRMGDYGETAMAMQRLFENLPADVRYRISMNDELQRSLFTGINRVEDFTPENLAALQRRIEGIAPLPYMTKSAAKGLSLGREYNDSFSEAIDRDDPYAMAYARSVKERWSGRMPAYRESEEYRIVDDYIRRKGRDDLTPEESREMFRLVSSRNTETRSMEEYAENENKSMFINDVITNRTKDHASAEYNEFMSILSDNHPQLTFEKMREIIEPAMRRDSREEGGLISNNEFREIIQAFRELIPALKDSSTLIIEQKDTP